MKNLQKGFVVPALVTIIALLVIGGGIYIYNDKKSDVSPEIDIATQSNNSQQPDSIQTSTANQQANNSGANAPSAAVTWQTYSNPEYGFQMAYPSGTQIKDVDISGGRNVIFTTSQGTVMVEVVTKAWRNGELSSPPTCDDTASGVDRTNTKINGVDFVTYDVSRELSGMNSPTSAMEYCAIQSNIAYKIIPRVSYPRGTRPPSVNENTVLNQMVMSFKLTYDSVKPKITILSPNGGETYNQGSPITVKWSQNFSASASICLMGDAGCVYNSEPVMFKSGVNTWTIPAGINIATCTTNSCYIADGFKVRVTTDNQPGSGHAGEFMNDESNAYFVIMPTQAIPQAKAILENIRIQPGYSYPVVASLGYKNIPGYKLSVTPSQISIAQRNLNPIGEAANPYYFGDKVQNAYENWHILCMIVGLGSGSSPSDLPYVWCGDKIGIQTIDVVVKKIKGINTSPRDFMLTIGNETMKVRMPAVVQNTNYQNGTYADFVKAITSSQYQNSTFKMTGEIKGDAFEVISIQWLLG